MVGSIVWRLQKNAIHAIEDVGIEAATVRLEGIDRTGYDAFVLEDGKRVRGEDGEALTTRHTWPKGTDVNRILAYADLMNSWRDA